jgi:nitrogen fixation/metabolism regulation signal transduction histidine kinase
MRQDGAAFADYDLPTLVSHGKEKGIGHGLTVVHKMVQDHGGEVLIERTGPEGTLLRLIFPAECA